MSVYQLAVLALIAFVPVAAVSEKILSRQEVYIGQPRIVRSEAPSSATPDSAEPDDSKPGERGPGASAEQRPGAAASSAGATYQDRAGRTYANRKALFRISAPDFTDLEYIEYRIDHGPFLRYTAPFAIGQAGAHTVQHRGVDRAGNVEAVRDFLVIVDDEPPRVAFYTAMGAAASGLVVMKPGGNVRVRVYDAISGVRAYHVDVGNGFAPGRDEPYAFHNEGTQLVRVAAEDNVGNRSAESHLRVLVDATPPMVSVAASPTVRTLSSGDQYCHGATVVRVQATDVGSGVVAVHYRLSGDQAWQLYSQPIPVLGNGDFRLETRAVDVAGNVSHSVRFACRVDRLAPVTKLRVGDQTLSPSGAAP